MKHQIIVIHGGNTYDSYEEYIADLEAMELDFGRIRQKDWKGTLSERLGSGYDVVAPSMPNNKNAKYLEWKIWFDKIVPFLEAEVVLVGHSLGGIFLAKYLSENPFSKKIVATFLVAAPFDAGDFGDSLADFVLPESLALLEKQGGQIYLFQSKDDSIVPFKNVDLYAARLPEATARILDGRGHINQAEFPEIVTDIQNLFT